MGGTIGVESQLGRGSQFHFTTQVSVANAKQIEIGTVAPPEILRGVKVLVVDDNRTNRRILCAPLNVTDSPAFEESPQLLVNPQGTVYLSWSSALPNSNSLGLERQLRLHP
jgi:hypothetical protein